MLLNKEAVLNLVLHCRYSHTSHVIGDYLILIGGVNYEHSPPGAAVVHLPSGQSKEFSLIVSYICSIFSVI